MREHILIAAAIFRLNNRNPEEKTTIPLIGAVKTVEKETPVYEYYDNEWELSETGQRDHKPGNPGSETVAGQADGFGAREILSAKLAAWLSGYLSR